ncbi:MAG: class I SAM-dependent methyltransferase [Deltaproteobacteria bacterium]
MKRQDHLLEVHEQAWCPAELRDGLTDIIKNLVRALRLYDPVLPLLERAIKMSGATRIVDLCSGAGGPWVAWADRDQLPSVEKISLSDVFPNAAAAAQLRTPLDYHSQPVDARHVDPSLSGLRTLFTSMHQFRRDEVEAMLGDAAAVRQPIAVFEFTSRSVFATGLFLLATPLMVWLLALRYPPHRALRWLLTFLVPALPVVATLDGVVSCLRSYRPAELLEMGRAAAPEGFLWMVGTVYGWRYPLPITYLIGIPSWMPEPVGSNRLDGGVAHAHA